ncbi:MAG: DUF423 domain-containing protein [Leptospira sp.]|nr:DUF423 domain-containing protein [Leptospira sp.]
MGKIWILLGSVFMFLAVGIGAFGAHGLKDVLSPEMKAVFETGNKYHFYHALALLLVGVLSGRNNISESLQAHYKSAGIFFSIGIVIFAGTLYTLAITEIKILGAITPIGGISFLIGWLILIFSYRKS